ncbi:hypothetical protein KR059_000107, partial [Drosophila kikkawai]
IMWVGPRVQKDIFDIIVKWRKWEFVVLADIVKMYRQIKINNDQKYQKILWRNSPEKIKNYKLTTVTYGTASEPYLATRFLVDIAEKFENQKISAIIRNDFYMDDLMTGADSVEEANKLIKLVSQELEKVGFNLRKWISNDLKILTTVEDTGDKLEKDRINWHFIPPAGPHFGDLKTLGLIWNPQADVFKYRVSKVSSDQLVTKRSILSFIATLFDPLGLLCPIITKAKIFLQEA